MTTRLELRVSRAIAGLATMWFALAAAWEMGGPMLGGHYASSSSVGIIAENMLRWRIAGPVWEYVATRPEPTAYYCHHPWGIFWTTAALMGVFGRHDFVCRLAPVLLSVATPPLHYALGRALWRPAAGAAAAAAFVVVPIALSFAHFNALEVPVMAWSLMGAWGFVRLAQTGRKAFLAVSGVGTFMALHADWPAFVFISALLGFALARATILRGTFGPLEHPRLYRVWWGTSAVLAVSTLALYAWLFARSGKLHDLSDIYDQRSAAKVGISAVAAILARRGWLELSFTEVGLVLGVVGALVQAARVVHLRCEHEIVPLAFLLMAAVQYVVFREGADMHVFWPHYFAVPLALGAGVLVETGASVLERGGSVAPGLVALFGMLVPLLLMLRDAIPILRYARETGGRFEEKGNLIDSDGETVAALRWLDARLPRDQAVALGRSTMPNWSQVWALGGRRVVVNAGPPKAGDPDWLRAWVGDARRMPDSLQLDLASRFHVTAVGSLWIIDPAESAAPIDAYAVDEQEPTALQWYFVSGTEPVRSIRPDPFRTWELRVHLGQSARAPQEEPVGLDQKRVAYAIARTEGDEGRAEALLQELTRAMSPVGPAGQHLSDGTEVLGTTREGGVDPHVTVWLRAEQPAASSQSQIAAFSQVDGRAPLSFVMADPVVREVGQPLALPPHLWRAGWIYRDRIEIRHRLGAERYWVESTRARKPQPMEGVRVEIARLP